MYPCSSPQRYQYALLIQSMKEKTQYKKLMPYTTIILDTLSLYNKDIESVFDITDNGIAVLQWSFPIDVIARFYIATFRRRDMHLITKSLKKRHEVGFALLSLREPNQQGTRLFYSVVKKYFYK